MASGIAIGVSLLLGVALGPVALLVLMPVTTVLALLSRGVSRPLLAIVLAITTLGILRGMTVQAEPFAMLPPGVDQAVAVVSKVPVAGGEFERTVLSLEQVRAEGGPWREASGKVVAYFPDQGEGVSLHDRVFVIWNVTPLPELSPGYANHVQGQGAIASAWIYAYNVNDHGPSLFDAVADARRAVSRNLAEAFGGDPGALASGIVTGDDSAMSDETKDAFRKTGTAHVTAVSGQNVSLLIGFLSLWLRPKGRWSRLASHGSMLVAVWIFALMVGMEAPALRASIVATLTILGSWSGRKPDPLTLLALSLGVMAFLSPDVTNSVGFWLSAAASWALCSVIQPEAPDGFAAKALGLGMGPLAASLATLPILIWTFDEWSPIAPLANAALTPIMTVLFPVTYVFAALSFVPGPWADLVGWIPGIGLDVSLSIVDRLSRLAPQVHLDATGPRGVVMIAIPALLLLLAWSRDGARWMRPAVWRR